MKISIIIPAHNEEEIIEKTIKKTYDVLNKSMYNFEILVVDDNSSDKTGEIIESLSKTYKNIKPLHKKSKLMGPGGMGSALRFGFNNCKGDVVIPLMGDLSDDPNDIPKLVNKILEGYDVVCGSRFLKGSVVTNYPFIKLICNRLYNKLFASLFFLNVQDISNAFKAYKKEVLLKVGPESKGFEITSEIVLKAHIQKFKISEVPVSWRGRDNENESKFGSFNSIRFIIFRLPKIGFSYFKPSLKLWLKFLYKNL
jgi:glycosyltransferase involved in cell wall biosynthesis